MRELNITELDSVSGGHDPERRLPTVVVRGRRRSSFQEERAMRGIMGGAVPAQSSDEMLLAGGGERAPSHPCNDNDIQDDFAIEMRNLIEYLPNSENREWGMTLALGADGQPYIVGGTAYGGNSDSTMVALPGTAGADVFGFIHNHPAGSGSEAENYNDLNRYPSDNDWDAADAFVNDGADPDNLSIFIMDADGDLREFAYSDRDLYGGLSQEEREDGDNLPAEMEDDLAVGMECRQ